MKDNHFFHISVFFRSVVYFLVTYLIAVYSALNEKGFAMKYRGFSTALAAGLVCLSLAGCGQDDLSPLQKAAAQGNADAQYLLGHSYYFGTGCPQNYKEVMEWCHLAAKPEHAAARSHLGDDAQHHTSVRQDCQKAVKWFRAAAQQGHTGARMLIGTAYFLGCGVPQNNTEAIKWLRMAAEEGDAGAQGLLGKCYFFGDGVEKNCAQAYAWFHLAAGKGFEKAVEDKSLCSQEMSPEEIEEGLRFAEEYAKNYEL